MRPVPAAFPLKDAPSPIPYPSKVGGGGHLGPKRVMAFLLNNTMTQGEHLHIMGSFWFLLG